MPYYKKVLVFYKFRIYPDREQEEMISKMLYIFRLCYNSEVEILKDNYKNDKECRIPNYREALLLKHPETLPLLKDIPSSSSLSNIRRELYVALGKVGKDINRLHFKSSQDRNTSVIYSKNNSIRFESGGLRLPRLGIIKGKYHRFVKGKIRSCTIIREKNGKYFVSLSSEEKLKIDSEDVKPLRCTDREKKERILGIDMSTKCVAVLSTGERIHIPEYIDKTRYKYAKAKKRLKEDEKIEYKIYKRRVETLKIKYNNQVYDYLNKLSSYLSHEYGTVVVEDLDLTHYYSKNVHYFVILKKLLSEKMDNFIVASRYFRSSQTCSNCGYVNVKMRDLSKRVFDCPVCKMSLDRDINAALNLSHYLFVFPSFRE